MVDVPDNRAAYQTRLDLREKYGVFVDVIAGVNVASAEVFWELRSVDPATGDVPSNPLVGFLPPNAEGSGQGFVSYTVKAKRAAETGTRIDAQARIVFDINEPINTPPISSVSPLPAESESRFLVSWAGDDGDGSGVAGFACPCP